MQFNLRLSLFAVLVITLSFFNTGCNGAKSGETSFGSLNVTPPPPPAPSGPDGTSDGLGQDETQFYVGVNKTVNSIAHVRRSTSFSENCAINKTSTSNEDIKCIIDIPEAEVFNQPLTLRFNIPKDMCRYIRRSTYWYYNQEVGIGPTSVVMNLDFDDTGPTPVLTSFTCSVDGGPVGACTGFTEVDINQQTQSATCKYDLSASSVGKNCCFGKYTLTKNYNYIVQADLTSTVTSNWGGSMDNCIGGPGASWPQKTSKGVPLSLVELSKDGLKKDYPLNSLLTTIASDTTIPRANYYDPVLHTHTGIVFPRSTNLPYFLDPVDDRNGTPIPTNVFNPDNYLVPGNDAYVFECMDEAFEVKHRIKAYVREWDTYADYLTYIGTSGVTEIPDRGSASEPGPSCSGVTGSCNDFWDIDDYLNLYLGLPGYTTPSAGVRDSYFPNVPLK